MEKARNGKTNENLIEKRRFIWIIILLSALVILLITLLLTKDSRGVLNSSEVGYMQVTVHDGDTDMPLEGATVVIPETGYTYTTDSQGQTPIMELPVYYDEQNLRLYEQNYGRITVIVYCDGYVPYALYYTHVEPGKLRQGPNVWMFPGNGEPFSVIEGPSDEWSRRVVEEYRP